MAGLAALMTRKKRDRRRELELRQQMQDSGTMPELTGKQAEEAMERKAAHETIKKMLIGKELLRQKSKSFDALSQVSYGENEDGSPKYGPGSAYNSIYIGLILMCIGAVITFVGLGEKGFKTLELKLIGPILMLVGFSCITAKIIMCTFPQLFKYPSFIKKLADGDRSNLMEKGVNNKRHSQSQNGRVSKNQSNNPSAKGSPNFVSPRVTLQSSKKVNRPRSTIPNYIEDSSEDEDDFDPGRSRPHSNRYNSVEVANSNQNGVDKSQKKNETNLQPVPKSQDSQNSQISQIQVQKPTTEPPAQNQEEILLTPKALML